MTSDKIYLYVHIPKTSGLYVKTSILGNKKSNIIFYDYKVIENNSTQNMMNEHAKISKIKKSISSENLKHIKFFTIVRNPYDRLYSLWKFFLPKKDEVINPFGILLPKDFEEFVYDYCNGFYDKFHLMQPQQYFLEGESIKNIKILKFEERKKINAFLKNNNAFIGDIKMNETSSIQEKEYSDAYNDAMKDVVYNKLKEEFILFNYSR
jgi:hypothetical protein